MTIPRRVCTIIARNYWAHARVLARSLHEVHPDAELTVLCVDADAATVKAAAREPFRVVCPLSIGLDADEFRRMAAIYDVMELSTSLKPWLVRHLFERDEAPVVYLDPDIRLFSSIEDAWELASEHGIVLTPHNVAPLPEDAREPSELTMLVSGIYNLGFIALGARARGFIDWWADRLSRNGLNAQPDGMFVDQRWVDLASSYFDVHVIRDPGWNVAFWNLPTRNIERADGSYLVDGSPLRFFHYSGFDPNRPGRLSRFQGADPRIDLAKRPVLGGLCARYAGELLAAGYDAYTHLAYGFDRSVAGLALGEAERAAYRKELIRAEVDGAPEPPNPLDPDEAPDFARWLREGPQLTPDDPPSGVNIAGYVNAESGVGECARMLIAAVDAAGIERSVVTFDRTDSRQQAAFDASGASTTPDYAINIVAVNADQFANFAAEHPDLLEGRYTIGVWNWEVEKLPEQMAASAALADEIWVASEFTANAVRASVDKPVHVFPIPVVRRDTVQRSRAELGLPEGFCFLFCFDFDSVFARKDPIAVIDAFSKAFDPDEGPHLVIKSVRGDAHPAQLQELRAAVHRPDIHILDGYLSSEDQHALMASADAYVSLHRAEGFGLTIAEAMSNGKPVVATAYSGNLEFMDETNSWLVRYDLVPIGPGSDPYPADARWAEPDIAAAAAAMREIVSSPDEARARGERAASDIARLHAPSVRASFIRDRLERIAKENPPPPPPLPEPKPAMQPHRPESPALAEIRTLLERGPDLASPARMPGLSRRLRSFVLRVLRHHDEHNVLVGRAIIAAIEEMHAFEQDMRDEMWKLYRLEHRTDDVQRKGAELEAELDEARARIRDLEGRLRQQRRHIRDLEAGR